MASCHLEECGFGKSPKTLSTSTFSSMVGLAMYADYMHMGGQYSFPMRNPLFFVVVSYQTTFESQELFIKT